MFLSAVVFFSALHASSVDQRDDLDSKTKVRVTRVVKPTTDFSKPERFEAMQGGAGTSQSIFNRDAFSQSAKNLTFEQELDFKLGNALFRKLWVSSPSSTHASDGLGPFYNARACQSCHLKDGRGRPPEPGEAAVSLFLRLARTPVIAEERQEIKEHKRQTFPDPVYGGQLQNFAVPGLMAEGRMGIHYERVPITLSDGSVVELQKPVYSARDLQHGPLHKNTTISPRVAPPMIGLGLIENIHDADLRALADPNDKNGDGISGKIQWVSKRDGRLAVGRFGWKAANVTVRAQSAGAFAGDIGISSPDVPNHYGDCTSAQTACLALPNGVQKRLGDTEAPDPVLDLVTFYSQNLAVPKRRGVADETVLAGKKLFYKAGCTSCHTPKFVTRKDVPQKAHRFQLIWPYSDFLLHDMGEGLADGQPVGAANGREWKTPPLWGIGLTQTVSGHTRFLHDGRARNLTEAILWHGGEAKESRDHFANLTAKDRASLIAFLESL
ncbi:MAG: di-heme oxidoredictase family protein [Pseudomonadota bacterium]